MGSTAYRDDVACADLGAVDQVGGVTSECRLCRDDPVHAGVCKCASVQNGRAGWH